jgi:hypothetical protein
MNTKCNTQQELEQWSLHFLYLPPIDCNWATLGVRLQTRTGYVCVRIIIIISQHETEKMLQLSFVLLHKSNRISDGKQTGTTGMLFLLTDWLTDKTVSCLFSFDHSVWGTVLMENKAISYRHIRYEKIPVDYSICKEWWSYFVFNMTSLILLVDKCRGISWHRQFFVQDI